MTPNESCIEHAEHIALREAFTSACIQRGLAPDPLFFWYHTIDLGDGLITPGSFDYRATLQQFGFPASMSGMTALDVGSASGFFAFEMERLGAEVTSTELPALSCWDRFPGESPTGIVEKIRERLPYHSTLPIEEITRTFSTMSESDLYNILLDGPFKFCHQVLGSCVQRVYTRIYDLGQQFGPEPRFDLVLLSDVLVHTVDPLHALAAVAGRCKGTLVIADEFVGSPDDPPRLNYVAGAAANSDIAEWWRPNLSWIRMVLSRLGFRTEEAVSAVAGRIRPGGEAYQKQVIHAHRV